MSDEPGSAVTSIVPPGASSDVLGLLGLGVIVAGLGGLLIVASGRRRREPASAGAVALAGTAGSMPAPVPATGPRFAASVVAADEANVPRWLRASVRAERFRTSDRDEQAAAGHRPRRGAKFSEPSVEAANRMLVRYERVEILEQPNEAYGRLLTEVGTNDEVDVLEVRDAWALVRTPGGVTGWLPTMVLDRPASEVSAANAGPEEPTEPPPARPRGRRSTR